MDKIKEQANVVSQLLFSSDTGDTYKKTLLLTWKILRETAILVWLVLCLTMVGGEWFYRNSVALGRKARIWYNGLGEKTEAGEAGDSMALTGQALLDSVQSGTSYVLSRARQQLGIKEPDPIPPPAPKAPKAKPAVESSAASTVTATAAPPMEPKVAAETKVADQPEDEDSEAI